MSTQIERLDEFPQMLTVDQFVKMLQLPSKETVYFWNKYGKGPSYYRAGRYIRYNKSDVLAGRATELLVMSSRAASGQATSCPHSCPMEPQRTPGQGRLKAVA